MPSPDLIPQVQRQLLTQLLLLRPQWRYQKDINPYVPLYLLFPNSELTHNDGPQPGNSIPNPQQQSLPASSGPERRTSFASHMERANLSTSEIDNIASYLNEFLVYSEHR